MSDCVVTLATYVHLADALHDWDRLPSLSIRKQCDSVDAVLVEVDRDCVAHLHRLPTFGSAHAAAASAVVALLWPAAMVSGALAGGVGETIIVVANRGLSRGDTIKLGEVLDEGRYAIALIEFAGPGGADGVADRPWCRASAIASTRSTFTDDDVLWALLADSVVT
jgi:hypothetical protein